MCVRVCVDSLQPLVKNPQLEARWLRRPPFRLLHQIVLGLVAYQNFPAELFLEDELNLANLKVL
jgi:hypothetical protein